jgi:RNA 3'-terminal phosphate cyclase (GTP)
MHVLLLVNKNIINLSSKTSYMLQIDGSTLEGSGQLVRTALAFSTLTQKPFEVVNIRANRPNPGLKAQHLKCIEALQHLCNAKAGHAELSSTRLRYIPGKIKGKTISVDIGTAGSVSLLLQAVLLPSLFADSKVHLKITGGTAAKFAMPYEYFENVLLPYIQRFCKSIDSKQVTRGYFPKGAGTIDLIIKPKFNINDFTSFGEFRNFLNLSLPKFNLMEQGTLQRIAGISHASTMLNKQEVAERQAHAAKVSLLSSNVPVNIQSEYSNTLSPGSGITLWAQFSKQQDNIHQEQELTNNEEPLILGADALGEQSKRSEAVGQEAADKLLKEIKSNAPIDSHLADSLVPLIALYPGNQIHVSEITMHTKTNIWITNKFLGDVLELDEKNKIIKSKA